MTPWRMFACLTVVAAVAACAAAEPPGNDLGQLLRDAEASREVLARGARWIVEVRTEAQGRQRNVMSVECQGSRALLEVVEPEASRGNRYLLADGSAWFHRAGGKRAVAISARESVGGAAIMADVAGGSLLADHDIVSSTGGQALDGEPCAMFDLVAKPGARVAHARVHVWVAEGARLVRQARFLTAAGRPIATATFRHEARLAAGGKDMSMPSMISIEAELGTRKLTVLRFSDYHLASFPEGRFDLAALATPAATSTPIAAPEPIAAPGSGK